MHVQFRYETWVSPISSLVRLILLLKLPRKGVVSQGGSTFSGKNTSRRNITQVGNVGGDFSSS